MKKWILFALSALLLTGCGALPTGEVTSAPTDTQPAATAPSDPSSLFSQRDFESDYSLLSAVKIDLGEPAAANNVLWDGNALTITAEGTYLLSGTMENGSVIVDTDKQSKVQLILSGAVIHSQTSAPIYVRQADKVFITLDGGTENSLSCGESYLCQEDVNIDSVIFSRDDLTLNGSGSLTLTAPAGHGIVSKDDLRITGGAYHITAAGHGMTAKDALSIAQGDFTIDAGKDGIHAENEEDTACGTVYIENGSYRITCAGDGISAGAWLHIEDGSFCLLCGGGSEYGKTHSSDVFGGGMGRPGGFGGYGYPSDTQTETETETVSCKGLKSTGSLTVEGGIYQIDSADDALHSNSALTVSDGSFTIATGDDGFHADEGLTVNGGCIDISQCYEGLEGLTITIDGGTVTVKSDDDGLNAAGGNDQSGFGGHGGRPGGMGGDQFGSSSESFILITGGEIFIDAQGDGIDSNGDLTVIGGKTVVEGPTGGGNGALDYGGTGTISGGTLLVTGSLQMAQSIRTTGSQGVLAINTGSCAAGTQLRITDSQGNTVVALQPKKAFGCAIVSCPQLISGQVYTVTVGSESAQFTA